MYLHMQKMATNEIPCSHGVAAARHERNKPETMVDDCYSLKFYVKAYGHSIWPVRDKKFWKKTNNIHVHAPAVKVKKGRKQKNRRLAPKEIEDGTRLSRHGTVIHCGHCGVPGHNRGGCPDLQPNGKRKRVAEEDEFTVDDVQVCTTAIFLCFHCSLRFPLLTVCF